MWLTSEKVVRAALDDLARDARVSIPGLRYKVLVAASRLVPRALSRRIASSSAEARGRT